MVLSIREFGSRQSKENQSGPHQSEKSTTQLLRVGYTLYLTQLRNAILV